MGKESERRNDWGRVMVSIHDLVPKGGFYLCIKEGERLINLCSGSLNELGDSFCANGEARIYVLSGRDVFYVFNPSDISDFEIRKKILPAGISLDD
ncbi:hypothetical protein AUJ42_00975 [Candidatus Collierbacteria bacterium CG1_02_44_10]|uniref:Uncharacterized protein n=4 Tax=Candidatus Collieribacteriota TaxID=1752725 RepID=A0A2H0DT14_9BACT|nr:hypothetical protein [bacterium]OIN92077.1 MAG: hypothetical protein AUJ42_00975 [Candidatus Collierbacteria bacterium CG1_02_44_10]PIP85316.1 MAG: hypothetical protein COW83_04910 [Candidatus Collierbacteria bacterium CG22_combo_CG10-13_8_21_14_all_43_12]PIR99895.1 MAG: hypothetical protein COT86_01560 [Candidatus Collierbacteria bacterium CG10_big_fil_rev_8_21_14_0_10_43_36]PJB47110.1 MAG: hypothetical protein CO104_04580 [Candidatus Collierbacteria bacterium CG_4_9_14_3_um_filter_43_16]